jgi:signal transduction histidine kinase
VAGWLSIHDRGEGLAQLATVTWWLRAAVFVAVFAIVLSASGSRLAGIVELAIGAAALACWWESERRDGGARARTLSGCLTVLAATGGFAATSHHDTSVLALAIMGLISAGTDLPLSGLLAALFAGVLGVEVGAVIYNDTDLGTVLGYPALLAAVAVAGRYRRAYRVQVEQAQALLEVSERAQREAERAAALTERSRIAREIHDVLAHSLGALGIQLQVAEGMLSERGDVDGALGSIANAQRLVDEGLTETRRAVHALRTDAPPLPEAIAALLSDADGRLVLDGEPYPLSPAAGLALLRTAQEAVTNAHKHAAGMAVAVALTYDQASVGLAVENDLPDPGLQPATATGGYGLAGMHERLRLIGGELTAGPAGGRWAVRARVTR